jgi:hypothetical protein
MRSVKTIVIKAIEPETLCGFGRLSVTSTGVLSRLIGHLRLRANEQIIFFRTDLSLIISPAQKAVVFDLASQRMGRGWL